MRRASDPRREALNFNQLRDEKRKDHFLSQHLEETTQEFGKKFREHCCQVSQGNNTMKTILFSRTGMLALILGLLFLAFNHRTLAGQHEYEVFDGRVYNGKYYPRADIIEWNEEGHPNHMEFHLYYKNKPLELSFKLEESTGKKIMLVNYFFPDRNEHLCRRVPAPEGFRTPFVVYRDESDKDFDNIILSLDELPTAATVAAGRVRVASPTPYVGCQEEEADESSRSTASSNGDSASNNKRSAASAEAGARPNSAGEGPKKSAHFEDW